MKKRAKVVKAAKVKAKAKSAKTVRRTVPNLALPTSDATVLTGDCREVLDTLPPESVHCVITSPPYFGLRDYGTGAWVGGDAACEHSQGRGTNVKQTKHPNGGGYPAGAAHRGGNPRVCGKCGARRIDNQLGLEASVEDYVASLVKVFRKVRRVLRPDGAVWLNLGDSFSHGGCGARDPSRWPKQSRNDHLPVHAKARTGLKPKDLMMIPARVVLALQADGWWNRGDVIWHKPNPMTESVKDRPTRAHEYLYLLTRSPEYFYDWLAVAEPATTPKRRPAAAARAGKNEASGLKRYDGFNDRWWREGGRAIRQKRSVWTIPTQPLAKIPHFATFPEALAEPCLLASTSPMGVCATCGAPLEREVMEIRTLDGEPTDLGAFRTTSKGEPHSSAGATEGVGHGRIVTDRYTLGWKTTCPVLSATLPGATFKSAAKAARAARAKGKKPGHIPPEVPGQLDQFAGFVRPARVPAVVLDPFCGTGTVGVVALKHGRRFVGIELNPKSVADALARMEGINRPLFPDLVDATLPTPEADAAPIPDVDAEPTEAERDGHPRTTEPDPAQGELAVS